MEESHRYENGLATLIKMYSDDTQEYARVPTLRELLYARHDEVRLQSYYDGNDLNWQPDDRFNFNVKDDQIAGVGSTPVEAVAKLWLAISASQRKKFLHS